MSRAMKNSGIPWIGEVPSYWSIRRLKTAYSLHGRIGWNGLRSDEFEEKSYAYLITGQDFSKAEIDWSKCYQISKERYDEDEFIQLKNGDMLITKDGTIGKIAMVVGLNKPACLNSGIFVMRSTSPIHTQRYLFWMLSSSILKAYNDYSNLGGTTIIHLYQNVFERMQLLVPPISEQQTIADCLDKKCSEIDEMVELQEKIIKELKAYKQSVITETVTKGLNPDVPMKHSGIECIGLIPQRWEVLKTLWVLDMPITDGPHTTPELYDTGIPFVSAEAVSCGNGGIDFNHIRGYISQAFYEECCPKYIPQKGDVYMIKSGATTGKVSIVNTDKVFTIWSPIAVYRANPDVILPRFLFYAIQSEYYQEQVRLGWTFGTQQNIGMRALENLFVVLPTIAEQQVIVDSLDSTCVKIDTLISVKQSKIEALKEYKKSIIYEYVTGKKEVNG